MHQTQSVRTTSGVVNRRKKGSVSWFLLRVFFRRGRFVLEVCYTGFCHRVFILKGFVLRCYNAFYRWFYLSLSGSFVLRGFVTRGFVGWICRGGYRYVSNSLAME